MQMTTGIYDFLAGPCLYITVPLCIAGFTRKTCIILSGRENGLKFPVMRRGASLPGITDTKRINLIGVVSLLFHIALFMAPLTAKAHGMLIDQSWGLLPPAIDPALTGILTRVVIITGLFFILRRTLIRHVFAVSSWRDYAAMICVLTPFVTGIFARKLIGSYETVMIIHCASAHVMLIAMGWTRLGHMVFFISGRIAVSGKKA
jgi:hypothetical protein